MNLKLEFRVNSTVLSITLDCSYGILYLASTTAFNPIVPSAVF
jgi:hypothetical protein